MTDRYPDTDIWACLLRAHRLRMFVARTEDEVELLSQVGTRLAGPTRPPAPPKQVGDLVPLSDREFDSLRSAIAAQVEPLRQAYLRGMATAQNDEQRQVLTELCRLIGPPRDS